MERRVYVSRWPSDHVDFVCDGHKDDVEISAAIELASAVGTDVLVTGDYPPKVVEEMKRYAEKHRLEITFREDISLYRDKPKGEVE